MAEPGASFAELFERIATARTAADLEAVIPAIRRLGDAETVGASVMRVWQQRWMEVTDRPLSDTRPLWEGPVS